LDRIKIAIIHVLNRRNNKKNGYWNNLVAHRHSFNYYRYYCRYCSTNHIKKKKKLKPKEVMGERGSQKTGFRDYYSSRPEDDLILAKIESRENVLIVGPPLAGKTRAAYQAFKRLNKPHNVIIPRCDDITLDMFLVPKNWKLWRSRILFLDDLQNTD
jgi:hypothetical protein